MKQILSRTERILRTLMGLIIVAVGIYGVMYNPPLGLFVLAVGGFTILEGITGWTFVGSLANAWIKPEGGSLELSGVKPQKRAPELK
jgi:hypothetical protein